MNQLETGENKLDIGMMNRLDRYLLSNIPPVISLERLQSGTVKERIEAAIQRIQISSKDHYDSISALSTYWATDDTGSKEDAVHFLETISQLEVEGTTVDTEALVLPDNEKVFALLSKTNALVGALTGARQLFILHYAGHGTGETTHNNLIITSRISQGADISGSRESRLNMTLVRDTLQDLATNSLGLDVLIVLDCCSASIAGRGKITTGERVELMAATSAGGISNSRMDGETFTIQWCRAFNAHFKAGKPFDCDKIMSHINKNAQLEQFPASFVLREGWGVPITFRAPPLSTTLALTPAQYSQTVITAIHVMEDVNSTSLNRLIEFLQGAPAEFKITVLAALPIASTLLLLRIPIYFQEMLEFPRVAFTLRDN